MSDGLSQLESAINDIENDLIACQSNAYLNGLFGLIVKEARNFALVRSMRPNSAIYKHNDDWYQYRFDIMDVDNAHLKRTYPQAYFNSGQSPSIEEVLQRLEQQP